VSSYAVRILRRKAKLDQKRDARIKNLFFAQNIWAKYVRESRTLEIFFLLKYDLAVSRTTAAFVKDILLTTKSNFVVRVST